MAPPSTDLEIASGSGTDILIDSSDVISKDVGEIEKILIEYSQDLPEIDIKDIDFPKLQKYLDNKLNTEFEIIKELSIMCRDKSITHPNWGLLSGRIQMHLLHKKTPRLFQNVQYY